MYCMVLDIKCMYLYSMYDRYMIPDSSMYIMQYNGIYVSVVYVLYVLYGI